MKREYLQPEAAALCIDAADALAASATGGTADPFGRDAGDGGMFPGGLDINPDLLW